MILFDKQITKGLISLCRCAGWSAPVLLLNPRRQVFSHQGQNYIVPEVLKLQGQIQDFLIEGSILQRGVGFVNCT